MTHMQFIIADLPVTDALQGGVKYITFGETELIYTQQYIIISQLHKGIISILVCVLSCLMYF